MNQKWDGKTRGSLLGYRFFVWCVDFFGIRISYFFSAFVAGYFFLFHSGPRRALISFYRTGFSQSKGQAAWFTLRNFNMFGRVLIDRVALKSPTRRRQFTFEFRNEEVLKEIHAAGKGGFLFSGHVGNWESSASLIAVRVTSAINVVMKDDEVEKIKAYLLESLGSPGFQMIPVREDMSHIVRIHQALKKNELLALLADRCSPGQDTFRLPFLNGQAHFPAGPFIMACKFKAPVTFVYAVKSGLTHYVFSATAPINQFSSPEDLALQYVKSLEDVVKRHPEQWFNFYDYYAG